jgi:hypothetical protein
MASLMRLSKGDQSRARVKDKRRKNDIFHMI